MERMWPTGKETEKGETVPHERYERLEASFPDAVNRSLVTAIESMRKNDGFPGEMPEGLSVYERNVWNRAETEGTVPELRFLIDIDGVLLDTDEKVRDFFRALSSGSVGEAREIANEKIAFSELRALLRCRNAASGPEDERRISVITDRLSRGAVCFPCFNRCEQELFSGHGIGVRPMAMKPISSGKGLFEAKKSDENDLIYYFGSSDTDRNLARRIRERMAKDGDKPERLVYVEIRQRGEKNIF